MKWSKGLNAENNSSIANQVIATRKSFLEKKMDTTYFWSSSEPRYAVEKELYSIYRFRG